MAMTLEVLFLLTIFRATFSAVIISEINPDNPAIDDQEFIELYNVADTPVSLESFVVVLYNGAYTPARAYDVIKFQNDDIIQPNGYYVIGSALVQPTPDKVLSTGKNILQNGPDAVALYFGSPTEFTVGMSPATENLVDVVVYTKYPVPTTLIYELAPGQRIVTESSMDDFSISRCYGLIPLDLSKFESGFPSPGQSNNCRTSPTEPATSRPALPQAPAVVINEVNADNVQVDDQEFIELFNLESRDVPLDNFVLVLYDGSTSGKAYDVITLTGYRIRQGGYFVVGSGNVNPLPDYVLPQGVNILENGPDAVALYYGYPEDYSVGMTPTTKDLVDVVIYTKYTSIASTPLVDTLTPGQKIILEGDIIDPSISRCGGFTPKSLAQFQAIAPTPARANSCPIPPVLPTTQPIPTSPPVVTTAQPPIPFPPPALVISEVNPDDPQTSDQQFIELYNPGRVLSLDYFTLVLYDGNLQAYQVLPLEGFSVQPSGYFVVGSRDLQPLPDKVFDVGTSIRQSGSQAVALYYGAAADYTTGMAPTSRNLVDVVIFTDASAITNTALATMVNILVPGQGATLRGAAVDSSISRCRGLSPRSQSMFKATYSSPGRMNDCRDMPPSPPATTTPTTTTATTTLAPPTPRPNILISEVNADNPRMDEQEFIELYNQENRDVLLDNFVIVLYNGVQLVAYDVIPLRGQTIKANGFFTIGSSKVLPMPGLVLPRDQHILQDGPDAVALYYGESTSYTVGMSPTAVNLVDAVVYSRYPDRLQTPLAGILTSGQNAVLETAKIPDSSISRCGGTIPREPTMFQATYPTPSELNDCRPLPTYAPRPSQPPNVVINEVNTDNPFIDEQEFIELYNQENYDVPLDNFVVVLYNGDMMMAYDIIFLRGQTVQSNGIFTIGSNKVKPLPNLVLPRNKHILQDGPAAVALYYGASRSYVDGMAPTADNLVDAVVYSKFPELTDTPLAGLLTSGPKAILERATIRDASISRCRGNVPSDPTMFQVTYPTPSAINDCRVLPTLAPRPSQPPPQLVINEVNADNPRMDRKEFVEIYNPGAEKVSLNSVFVVLYTGETDRSYGVINLSGYEIGPNSYFVVGSGLIVPRPDFVMRRNLNILKNGEEGIALYYNPMPGNYFRAPVTATNLIDAVVYSTNAWNGSNAILNVLTPGQQPLHEYSPQGAVNIDKSISRCTGNDPLSLNQFKLGSPTPGRQNDCGMVETTALPTITTTTITTTPIPRPISKPNVIISEVNADNPITGEQEFIELYNAESSAVLLDNFVLVLYDGSVLQKAYGIISLQGHAVEPNGYFVVGSDNVNPRPDMVLPVETKILRDGPDAVALYYSTTPAVYKLGMSPTTNDLVDVVIYTKHPGATNIPLIDALAPGQQVAVESGFVDVSVSRCGGFTPRDISQFQASLPSPSAPNDCRPLPTPSLLISEFNADNPGRGKQDPAEFVELYNPNDFRVPLDSVYLVLWEEEHNLAYNVIDLTGREISAKGYFVVGSKNVIPRPDYVTDKSIRWLNNGEDGIGLYYNPSKRYYNLMPLTTDGLLDAVVYSWVYWEGSNPILETLNPGQQALHENASFNAGDVDESLSRCNGLNPRRLSDFVMSFPTPGSRNNCSVNAPKIVINEVNADNPSYDRTEFIELYNKESTFVSLDSVFLVLYNGAIDKVYLTIDLTGFSIPSNGYFVVGSENLGRSPDYVLDKNQNVIQNGEDAVALYYDPGGSYKKGMPVMSDYLIDAVVYSTRSWTGSNLIQRILTPGQEPLHEFYAHNAGDQDESLGRCKGTDPINLAQFVLATPTPGEDNICDGSVPDKGDTDEQGAVGPVEARGKIAVSVIAVLIVLVSALGVGLYFYNRRLLIPAKETKGTANILYSDLAYDEGIDV